MLLRDACSKHPILLDFTICMLMTLERPQVRYLPTMRGTDSLPSLVLAGWTFFGLSLAFHFVFRVMVLAIGVLLDFLGLYIFIDIYGQYVNKGYSWVFSKMGMKTATELKHYSSPGYWNPVKKCSWSADPKAWPVKAIDGPPLA